ncbi:RNA polymerase sigma factor [Cyclobacterium jeungdonense]|uniref:Sigma-70 family RNA polymerase sigma factor n=1 Tax=Cyclobacterium jeungdonense TaxID=708087 RepID=A0ABT8C7I2_9BACT|nr:sigma-70 family RNA polymerase sigma factor [Cyclobacterium jeungdonense]MDN3688764.1 sigma-70 family RNA polymerase sigma factor [Cyclobacterium jeungdonense]
MEQPDKKLLDGFRNGDRKAFEKIYQYYRVPVIRFSVSIIKDEQEAENIYHEVFMKILKRRSKIRPELNFNSYVFTSVKNEIFDYLKALNKNNSLKEKFWERIYQEEDDCSQVKEEQLTKMESIIEGLSPKRRKILEMNYFEKKSYNEIADILMISKNTVKNQLVKAKFILRKEME